MTPSMATWQVQLQHVLPFVQRSHAITQHTTDTQHVVSTPIGAAIQRLRQSARMAPYSTLLLFGDSLSNLATESTKDKQNEIWLHGHANKQNKVSGSKAGRSAKASASTYMAGKGKQNKSKATAEQHQKSSKAASKQQQTNKKAQGVA